MKFAFCSVLVTITKRCVSYSPMSKEKHDKMQKMPFIHFELNTHTHGALERHLPNKCKSFNRKAPWRHYTSALLTSLLTQHTATNIWSTEPLAYCKSLFQVQHIFRLDGPIKALTMKFPSLIKVGKSRRTIES